MKTFKKILVGALSIGTLTSCGVNIAAGTPEASSNSSTISKTYNAEEVNSFDIHINTAKLNIAKRHDNMIYVDVQNKPNNFSIELSESTLEIKSDVKDITIFKSSENDKDTQITIGLPEKKFDKFILNTGNGKSDLKEIECNEFNFEYGETKPAFENINCDDFIISGGTGAVTAKNINCLNKMKIDIGAGNVNMVDCIVGEMYYEQGTGDLNYSGAINGNVKGSCGEGDINLHLTNPESDFSRDGGKYTMNFDIGTGNKNITYNN